MSSNTKAALLFIAELVLWTCYVPGSCLAYRWAKVPKRRERDLQAISRMEGPEGGGERLAPGAGQGERETFLWPVAMATLVPLLVLVLYHPFMRPVMLTLIDFVWPDFLALGSREQSLAAVACLIFWGFEGAFLYSFTTIWRRFLALDVTPNTYTYAGIRFANSMFVVGAVGGVLGAGGIMVTGQPLGERGLMPLCALVFFIGMFPDFGVAYLREFAKRYLGKALVAPEEVSLLCVSGMDLWHESRFRQDGINNAHNLAYTDLPRLIRSFPFPVGQLVAWVDEAILVTHTSRDQAAKLHAAGVRHASTVVRALRVEGHLQQLAAVTGLGADALSIIGLSLHQAANLPRVLRFRDYTPPPAG